MGVGENQKVVITMISQLLEIQPIKVKFDWFINKHREEHFKDHFIIIDNIFNQLKGDPVALELKRKQHLFADAYFTEPYFVMIEFDELQHFSTSRLLSLKEYPDDLKLGFNRNKYIELCGKYSVKADRYRTNLKPKEFKFDGGRNSQRAYLDTFRDILSIKYSLNPTIRISEFDLDERIENNTNNRRKIETILKRYL